MHKEETTTEASKKYLKKHEEEIMSDSLFSIVGSFRTKEGNWSERDDWRE